MTTSSASWNEVDELLGHADTRIVQQVVETGASLDEIGAAIDDLDELRQAGQAGQTRLPGTPRVAEVRRILEGMNGFEDDGTMPIAGVLI